MSVISILVCLLSLVAVSSAFIHQHAKPGSKTSMNAFLGDFSGIIAQLVPREVGIEDKVLNLPSVAASTPMLVPDNSIATLDGGENLGLILWAFVLYNGLFAISGRPAEWVLPVLARVVGVDVDNTNSTTDSYKDQDAWYRDYSDGYSFEVPPSVEFIRFGMFAILGYYANVFIVSSLGGDAFWGWSIGACLFIPSALLNAAREKLVTRQEAELFESLESAFRAFAEARFQRVVKARVIPSNSSYAEYVKPPKKKSPKEEGTEESRIIMLFRRNCVLCRTEEEVSDKVLKKVVRKVIGTKPVMGRYPNINVPTVNQRGKEANERSLALAAKMKADCEVDEQCEVDESECVEEGSCISEGSEFAR